MKAEHAAAMKRLETLKGKEFESAYIAHEVAMHQKVLDTIDQKLLPNVKDSALRDHLTKTRPVIQAHLMHAKRMHAAPAAQDHKH